MCGKNAYLELRARPSVPFRVSISSRHARTHSVADVSTTAGDSAYLNLRVDTAVAGARAILVLTASVAGHHDFDLSTMTGPRRLS